MTINLRQKIERDRYGDHALGKEIERYHYGVWLWIALSTGICVFTHMAFGSFFCCGLSHECEICEHIHDESAGPCKAVAVNPRLPMKAKITAILSTISSMPETMGSMGAPIP